MKPLSSTNEEEEKNNFTLKLNKMSTINIKRNSKIKIVTDFEDTEMMENLKSINSKQTLNSGMRESNADAYSNASSANFSRVDSLSKLNKMRSNFSIAKASNISVNEHIRKEKTFIPGHVTIEQRLEKARKRRETLKAKKELEIRLQKEREENEKREKEDRHKKIQFNALLTRFQNKIQQSVEEINQEVANIEKNMDNSDDEIMNEMKDSTGFTKKQELEEEKRLKELRIDLLRRDSFEETPFINMTTFSGDSNSRPSRHSRNKESASSDGVFKATEIKKIAYDLTDDAVEKEKFFKVVKQVISGVLLDQVLNIQNDRDNDETNKYSKANISNRQAQVKFIQK